MSKGYKCFNCGKGIMLGHEVSHAKNRTRKVFKPNLHPAKIMVNGTSMRVRLCTKCLRLLKGKTTMAKKAEAKLKEQNISTSAPAASALA
jgi:large subunit ribosomal protein L28